MFNANDVYRWLYPRWPTAERPLDPGYSLLVLTPGDLPVFMQLALRVCNRQDPTSLRETLVLSDSQLMPGFRETFEAEAKSYTASPVRLVNFDWPTLIANRFHPNPFNNCWHQLVNGIRETRTEHALLHDVDLFLFDRDALRRHYEYAVQHNLDCIGSSPPWDDWYRNNGHGHVVATWELLFRTEWARTHAPWVHRAQYGMVDGKGHSFDMMLMAQCRSDATRIRQSPHQPAFIHFSHVISTYRLFQRHRGAWEDDYFRLLLIRLLIDALDRSGWHYELPSLADLQAGIGRSDGRVTYATPDCRSNYREFRAKLEQLLVSDLLDAQQAHLMRAAVAPFDRAFLTDD
jgi:hypothetical protein